MAGPADFVTAVLAIPNLDCLLEMQEASGLPLDSSPNGFDMTSISGSVTYQVTGPGGTDFGISFNPGTTERNAPMNTNTADTAFGCWVRWIGSSVNQAMVENGSPGANGYGALLVASAALRGIAHGIGFKGTSAGELDDGLWQFVGMQITPAGDWEFFFGGQPDANNPVSTGGGISAPTTKFIVCRDGAQVEMAYLFSVSRALSDGEWEGLYTAMVGGPPINVTPPLLSGAAVVGQTLTTDDGSWTDADSFTYQWEWSADGSTGWTQLSGETANTYLVDAGDFGNWLRCFVTATNVDGDTDQPSNVLGPVIAVGAGPVLVVFSSGDSFDSFAETDWTPDTSGVEAGDYMIVNIEGSVGSATTITPPDGWEELENEVPIGNTRIATYAKLTYVDTPTETFTFNGGCNYAATLISVRGGFDPGLPIVDYVKTTNNTLGVVNYDDQDLVLGISVGGDTFAPAAMSAIPVGFTDEFVEASATVFAVGWIIDNAKLEAVGSGDTTGLSFTYTNGSDFYTLTILIPYNPGDVPVSTVPPVATGEAAVNETVHSTTGSWDFAPTGYTYQWQHSADGSTGWTNIVGATSADYIVEFSLEDEFLRCRVTATNAAGASVPEPTNVLGPVLQFPTVYSLSVIG